MSLAERPDAYDPRQNPPVGSSAVEKTLQLNQDSNSPEAAIIPATDRELFYKLRTRYAAQTLESWAKDGEITQTSIPEAMRRGIMIDYPTEFGLSHSDARELRDRAKNGLQSYYQVSEIIGIRPITDVEGIAGIREAYRIVNGHNQP